MSQQSPGPGQLEAWMCGHHQEERLIMRIKETPRKWAASILVCITYTKSLCQSKTLHQTKDDLKKTQHLNLWIFSTYPQTVVISWYIITWVQTRTDDRVGERGCLLQDLSWAGVFWMALNIYWVPFLGKFRVFLVYFSDKVSHFCPGQPWAVILYLLSSWDYSHGPPCPDKFNC
jgi:hypothetical protein